MSTQKPDDNRKISERAQAHQEMLEKALSRPGVSEYMRVYNNWKEKDQRLDAYRSIRQISVEIDTTSSTTPY